jgi:hypothetical protein
MFSQARSTSIGSLNFPDRRYMYIYRGMYINGTSWWHDFVLHGTTWWNDFVNMERVMVERDGLYSFL